MAMVDKIVSDYFIQLEKLELQVMPFDIYYKSNRIVLIKLILKKIKTKIQ